jgi:DNA-3-methyladenine glycosylase II
LARSSFTLEVAPPFRLDLTVWALRRRPVNQIDRWDGAAWRRTVIAGDGPVELAVTQVASMERPRLKVEMAGAPSEASESLIRQTLNRALGIDIDLALFYAMAARDSRLNELAGPFRGMRPPKFPTIFEALANGVTCQQLSLEAGLALLNRLVASHGQAPPFPPGAEKAFPRPCDLASANLQSLRALGFSRAKGVALIETASAAERRDIDLERLGNLDDAALCAKLDDLRGVGRWTAEYVLLRGFGRLNIFPGDDVGARNGLQRWLRLPRPLDYEGAKKILREWRPYGGLVYLHLLLKNLEEKGLIAGTEHRG